MSVQIIKKWVSRKYGTRRGILKTYWYRVLCFFGHYRVYRQIDWDSIDRIVFVCKGNICRSAYAEVVAKSIGIDSISCGIDTAPGLPANDEAIKVGAKRGFVLSNHKTTTAQSVTLRSTDLLIAMEPWQADFLRSKLAAEKGMCTLLGLWNKPVTPYIHDPYGNSPEYFNNCFDYIEKSVYEIAKKVSKD